MTDTAQYMSGFGNGFETEALPGALPVGRNSPQRCAYGLYAEQISGTPFTAPRSSNRRSWLYRIRPSLAHWGDMRPAGPGLWRTAPCAEVTVPPAPMRWNPLPLPRGPSASSKACTPSRRPETRRRIRVWGCMSISRRAAWTPTCFYNADAEMLIVPQQGALRLVTEFGVIGIAPGEIAVLPRGVKMRVELPDGTARGYVCENYGAPFSLPERGPIGANCLANPRDFLTPVAAYEDRSEPCRLVMKWGGALWETMLDHSPLDVVAWHGNYAPYKYNLQRFSPVGPVLFDHADPSIFTTLTSGSETAGTANVDFVIFPDRWLVSEDTFRPPWYHMNIMSEFMGLIYGVYDAKPHGFIPGGFSLHNSMLPHGPDHEAFEAASRAELRPQKLEGSLAFMFETRFPQRVTRFAAEAPERQRDYGLYGTRLERRFDPLRR